MTIPQVSGYGNFVYPYQAYPPQFNNWNNYGYSMPVFRGAEYQPVMQQPLSQDTVQLSAEKEIKTKKKEGLSTGAKWAIGLATTAATIYGGVVLHRHLTKPSIEKVAKNFSEIFRRDVSKEEALKLTERYKEIFKIKDKDEFCQKIFEQVKKDYGYSGVDIKLKKLPIEKIKKGDKGSFMASGYISYDPSQSRRSIYDTLVHEFQHAKQHEIAQRTDFNNYVIARIERMKKHQPEEYSAMLKELTSNGRSEKEALSEMKELIASRENIFVKYSQIKAGTEEYRKGLEYIKNEANYISPDVDMQGYLKQLVEEEAFSAGNKANEIYNFFANPWRLF